MDVGPGWRAAHLWEPGTLSSRSSSLLLWLPSPLILAFAHEAARFSSRGSVFLSLVVHGRFCRSHLSKFTQRFDWEKGPRWGRGPVPALMLRPASRRFLGVQTGDDHHAAPEVCARVTPVTHRYSAYPRAWHRALSLSVLVTGSSTIRGWLGLPSAHRCSLCEWIEAASPVSSGPSDVWAQPE